MRAWAGCWLSLPRSFIPLGVVKWVRNLAGLICLHGNSWFYKASCSGLFWWCVNDALTQSLHLSLYVGRRS